MVSISSVWNVSIDYKQIFGVCSAFSRFEILRYIKMSHIYFVGHVIWPPLALNLEAVVQKLQSGFDFQNVYMIRRKQI